MGNREMTKQELGEKIAEIFRQAYWFAREHPRHNEALDISDLTFIQADQTLSLIKEAGWIPPEEFVEAASEYCREAGWREPS